jgi:hypothetical protein
MYLEPDLPAEEPATEEEIRQAMLAHIRQKTDEIKVKYGFINYAALEKILLDRKFVRYPVSLRFDSSVIEAGMYALTESKLENPANVPDEEDAEYVKEPERVYEIILHEQFKGNETQLLPLILYQLPIINYGDMANHEVAEVFGSELLRIDQEAYYQLICELTDSIPG